MIIALFAAYFLLIKATDEITVDPKIIEQNKNILLSTTSNTNPSKNIIKGFIKIDKRISNKLSKRNQLKAINMQLRVLKKDLIKMVYG